MRKLFLKKIFKQSIIITLIVSLAFTPVAALENGSDVSQETSIEEQKEEQQQAPSAQQILEEDVPVSAEEGKEEEIEKENEESLITEQEASQQLEETEVIEELPEVSASSDDAYRTHEETQAYEEMADSWRFQDGRMLVEENSSAPRLYASFTPWEWSDSKGGYLSSDGSVIPGAIRKGIDVSVHQGKIDWAKVKADGIDFAIIRCGYGDNIRSQDDSKWEYNVQQCEKYGIPYGVYIYSYVESDSEAKSEVKHVLRLLKEADASPDYPVYYDLEDNMVRKHGKKKIVKWAKYFCDSIEAEGYRAGIYANLNWWNNYLNDSSLDKYEKWVAQYYKKCQYAKPYRIWQSTSSAKVSGISGNVDVNFELQMGDTDYSTGQWITNENGETVFQNTDGTIAVSQWIVDNDKKYYVDASGKKADGIQSISGGKYYFSDGVMQKSKWFKVSKKKYYASSNGKLVTGYKKIGNYYYGFNSKGAMLTGTKVLNGKKYKFMKNGKAYLFKAKIKTHLNYRKGPGTKYKRIGTYKKGKSVTIIRKNKSGKWGQMTNGYWVKLSYTKKTATYPLFVAYKAKVIKKTTYRKGAGTQYKKKGTYKKGKVVTIKGKKNGWGKMSNGYWIKLSYTKKI